MSGLGIFFSPFASIVLQSINYRALGMNDEVRKGIYWFISLFIADIIWMMLPLHLPSEDKLAAGMAFGLGLYFIWFLSAGRFYRKNIKEDVLAAAPIRSFISALGISFFVLISVVIAQTLLLMTIGA